MNTSQPSCPYCVGQTKVYKRGPNRSGSQRYQCTSCRHYFTPQPKPHGQPQATRELAVKMYLENVGLRSIGRLLAVSHVSVANWVNRAADQLPENVDALDPHTGEIVFAPAATTSPPAPTNAPPVSREIVIEADELYTYVGKKKSESTSF